MLLLDRLHRAGVKVKSLREPWMDPDSPTYDLLLPIFAWIAKQEALRISERVRAGLDRAVQRQATRRIVYRFNGSNGYAPSAELIFDNNGNLYGITGGGGASGDGTVFRLSFANRKWSETMLFSFDGSDGNGPAAILTSDSKGHYYGTTQGGGSSGWGVVFSLQP